MSNTLPNVTIYTDGSCRKNKNGGWASILIYKKTIKEIYGSSINTTNNQMELCAPLKALKLLKFKCNVIIYSDSQYVVKGGNQWMYKWASNNWITSTNKPVKNQDLWKELYSLCSQHSVEFAWVKGHNGDFYNERCDELATKASDF